MPSSLSENNKSLSKHVPTTCQPRVPRVPLGVQLDQKHGNTLQGSTQQWESRSHIYQDTTKTTACATGVFHTGCGSATKPCGTRQTHATYSACPAQSPVLPTCFSTENAPRAARGNNVHENRAITRRLRSGSPVGAENNACRDSLSSPFFLFELVHCYYGYFFVSLIRFSSFCVSWFDFYLM